MNYLGIIVDDRLQFKDHCDFMIKKIGKKIGFLNRIIICNSITAYNTCVIYKAIIALYFEYCATILINMSDIQLCMLQRAQNRAMRVILQYDRYKVEHMLHALQSVQTKNALCCLYFCL